MNALVAFGHAPQRAPVRAPQPPASGSLAPSFPASPSECGQKCVHFKLSSLSIHRTSPFYFSRIFALPGTGPRLGTWPKPG